MHATTTRKKIITKGLCHVAIDVSDVERSTAFYTAMFEMDIVGRTDRYVHLQTSGAHDSFFLFKADGPVSPQSCGMAHMHFGFRIDDENFDKAMKYIEKNHITIHPNPSRGAGRFVYIEDPDGYVIQLEPGDCE
jgi:catechol 2,3-dioxygenase-like lactoylglutathione lyase family enzyme